MGKGEGMKEKVCMQVRERENEYDRAGKQDRGREGGGEKENAHD